MSTTRKEDFVYDVLDRLDLAETFIDSSNTRDLDFDYNKLGNITSKTSTLAGDVDVTGYTYGAGAAGPHAVTWASIAGTAYTLTYDANGAITKYDRANSTTLDKYIQYNAANQPTAIVVGTSLLDADPTAKDVFRYDPDGNRYARESTWKEGGVTKTESVVYTGGVEFIDLWGHGNVGNVIKTRISPDVMHVRSVVSNSEFDVNGGYPFNEIAFNIEEIEYAHRDHLGSVETVTDSSGNRLIQVAFEPFGERKEDDWTSNISSTSLADVQKNEVVLAPLVLGQAPTVVSRRIPYARGFTGHEHFDRTGFIHMNGRVYDPELGRFISPDPIVQAPANSQNWNRYAYVSNDPLNAVDPSGYGENDVTDVGRHVVTGTCDKICQNERRLRDLHRVLNLYVDQMLTSKSTWSLSVRAGGENGGSPRLTDATWVV